MIFQSAYITDTGSRPVNEDAVEIWTARDGSLIAAVADGLGGMGSGGTASRIAIASIKEFFDIVEVTQAAIFQSAEFAHAKILSAQMESNEQNRMATTLTLLVFTKKRLLGCHAGDTRAIIARRRGIKRLTTDHSEAQRLFEAGKLSKKEMHSYPRQHILDSALGVHEKPRLDPISFGILPGDRFAITSDGVHNIIPLQELRFLIMKAPSPIEFVNSVKQLVDAIGPRDNYSIAAVFAV